MRKFLPFYSFRALFQIIKNIEHIQVLGKAIDTEIGQKSN